MEDLKVRRYVTSLENKMKMNLHFLSDIHNEFRERCKMVAPGRPFPPDVTSRVKRQYREIRDRLAEIRAIQQLLRGKYRRVAKKDPVRDKKIDELGFAFKNLFSRFEFNLRVIERLKREEQRKRQLLFRSPENNLKFVEGLKLVNKRDGGYHSISLVILLGDRGSIEKIYEGGIRLKGEDVLEKYGDNEIRMFIAHRQESEGRGIEEAMRRVVLSEGHKLVKCVIFRVKGEADMRRDVEGLLYQILDSMDNRELKVVR